MAEPAEAGDGFGKEVEEQPAVAVVQENVLPGVAVRRQMIDGAWIFDAQRPCHGGSIEGGEQKFNIQDLTPIVYWREFLLFHRWDSPQAAFLVLFPRTAGTRIVAADMLEGVPA